MRKWFKFVIGFIFLIVIFLVILYFMMGKYDSNLFNEVSKNTKIKDIVYVNKNNYNYVVLTKDYVYVFNDKYDLVLEKNRGNISSSKYNIVYKRNMLMYEEMTMYADYLVYSYYDVENEKLIYEVKIGR